MNYTKAAQALHITQPAVSMHIHFLEELYGVKLFKTEGKKIFLTDAGKLLYRTANAAVNDETVLKERIELQKSEKSPLYFGVTKTIGEYCISGRLIDFVKKNQTSSIKMIMANTKELLEKIKKGEIQFAVVEGYFPSSEFDSITIRKEDFIAVCGSGYKWEKKPEKLEDLLDEKIFIREEGSGTRDIFEKNLIARNLHISDFSSSVEIGSMKVIVDLIKENLGISFLYRAAVEKELEEGSVKEVKLSDYNLKHDFVFIWEKQSIFEEEYREICKKIFGV